MKFWRISSRVALVAAFSAASAFAAMAPRNPAAAGSSSSGNFCAAETRLQLKFPLVMCAERQASTSTGVGNQFPWEQSTFFFGSFRNQWLYPASTLNQLNANAQTIESIHSRAVSFASAATIHYGTGVGLFVGQNSTVRTTNSISGSLATTFAANTGLTEVCPLMTGTTAAPIRIGTIVGPNGRILSSCLSCPGDASPTSATSRDAWCAPGDIRPSVRAFNDIMQDHTLFVVAGGAGDTIWDVTSGGCSQPQRAFGSGNFANVNHLTTALGVDTFVKVWVFKGLAPPPPATVEQQIAEIIRLLLTPQGLRCSGLDMTPGNSLIEDNPVRFPAGKDIDPIMPQVSTGGTITGDELRDGLRQAGYQHP